MPVVKALKRLFPSFRPYRGELATGLVLVVVSAAFASVIPWLLQRAIDALVAGDPPSRIWRLAGYMVGLAIAGGAARYWMRELLNAISRKIERDLRNTLFAHLSTLDSGYYGRTRTGDLMARLTNDLGAVRMAAGPAIMYLVNTIAGGLFALAFMLRIDVRLSAIALLPMLLLPVVMAKLGTAIHTRFEDVQEHFSTITTMAQENLAGIRIVRAYRQEPSERDRFRGLNDEYLRRNLRLASLWGLMHPTFGVLGGLGSIAVLAIGGGLAMRGEITIGAFVAFGFYLGMLTWPLISLGWVTNLFQRAAASMARLTEILDEKPSVTSPALARRLPASLGGRSLEFRKVGFHYPPPAGSEPRWVLRDVSFTVPAGGTLGVVGATGSGKSALMDLIPRLHDPQEGEILLDGVPIRELSLDELRGAIGYVPQESLLFSETIGTNLAYGADDPAAAQWAAGIAALDETIAGFPGGYDTWLGERGINLSGGQKQRAALARALARRPGIVLLDDSLSAVDTHTEAAILRSLREGLSGRTAVISSHRISAIRDAGMIIVLAEGRIIEQGRHEALFATRGRYWSLLQRQQLVESIEEDADRTAEPVA